MSRTFDFMPDSVFPVALPFSMANPSANTTNKLTLPGGNGYIVPPGYNLHPIGLQAILNALPTNEYAANGGFETAGEAPDIFSGWTETPGNGTITDETGEGNFQAGEHSCKMVTGADLTISIAQDISVKSGYSYRFGLYVKGDGENVPHISIVDKEAPTTVLINDDFPSTVNTWYSSTWHFTVGEDTTSLTLTITGAGVEGATCYIDSVSLEIYEVPTPNASYKIAVDGTALTEGPNPGTTEIKQDGFDDAKPGFYPIAAGSEITISMITTANYSPNTADVDCILYGVLIHE